MDSLSLKRVLPGSRYAVRFTKSTWFAEPGDECVLVCDSIHHDTPQWHLENEEDVKFHTDRKSTEQLDFEFIAGPLPVPENTERQTYWYENPFNILLMAILIAIILTEINQCFHHLNSSKEPQPSTNSVRLVSSDCQSFDPTGSIAEPGWRS